MPINPTPSARKPIHGDVGPRRTRFLYALGVGGRRRGPVSRARVHHREHRRHPPAGAAHHGRRARRPGLGRWPTSARSTRPCSCTASSRSSCSAPSRPAGHGRYRGARWSASTTRARARWCVTEASPPTWPPPAAVQDAAVHCSSGARAAGGRPRPLRSNVAPEREPDHVVTYQTAPTRRSSTGCRATATRCTPIRRSRPWAASTSPSSTACAPTASPAGPCCTGRRAVTQAASGPSAPGSALRSRRAPHCEPPSGSKGRRAVHDPHRGGRGRADARPRLRRGRSPMTEAPQEIRPGPYTGDRDLLGEGGGGGAVAPPLRFMRPGRVLPWSPTAALPTATSSPGSAPRDAARSESFVINHVPAPGIRGTVRHRPDPARGGRQAHRNLLGVEPDPDAIQVRQMPVEVEFEQRGGVALPQFRVVSGGLTSAGTPS